MSNIYLVKVALSKGGDVKESLVRAHTKNGAVSHKRREISRQLVLGGEKASQDDVARLIKAGTEIESALDEPQTDIGDKA